MEERRVLLPKEDVLALAAHGFKVRLVGEQGGVTEGARATIRDGVGWWR
jgi:hypothetical protein